MRAVVASVIVLAGCGRGAPTPPPPAPVAAHAEATDAATPATAALPCDGKPDSLGTGLSHERWPIAATPAVGDHACFDLVRIDLARYQLRTLTAAHDGEPHTAPAWLAKYHLAAVVNAGMFEADGAPIGLLASGDGDVGHANAKLGGVLAFDPRDPSDAPALITGKTCAGYDLAAIRKRYRSVVEGYRMIDCDGTAIHWADRKHYSAAAIGVDRAGHAIMLHARAPVTMTELSAAAAQAGPAIAGALFVEGGPEASVVVHGDGDRALELLGSYETGFHESDDNADFWALPNVIGAVAR